MLITVAADKLPELCWQSGHKTTFQPSSGPGERPVADKAAGLEKRIKEVDIAALDQNEIF